MRPPQTSARVARSCIGTDRPPGSSCRTRVATHDKPLPGDPAHGMGWPAMPRTAGAPGPQTRGGRPLHPGAKPWHTCVAGVSFRAGLRSRRRMESQCPVQCPVCARGENFITIALYTWGWDSRAVRGSARPLHFLHWGGARTRGTCTQCETDSGGKGSWGPICVHRPRTIQCKT